VRAPVLAILLAASSAAVACGVCFEDKIASTYDHAVITQAIARKHHVAFFHIDGPVTPDESTKRWLEAAIAATPGTDKGSARVAVQTLTLSVAYDPRRISPLALQISLDKRLAAKSLSLRPLRVVEEMPTNPRP
jgi:hypothetical protein